MKSLIHRALLVVFFTAMSMSPLISFAQTQTQADLQSTIRAALAADPRTQGMPQPQIDAMVDALSQRAQKQGMTPSDITWRPVSTARAPYAATCGAFPTILCTLSSSFGFIGDDSTLPMWLFFASLLMIIIIMLLRRQYHLNAQVLMNTMPQTTP